MLKELDGPGSCKGYRGMWGLLRTSYGIQTSRDNAMSPLRQLDPEGTSQRKARRLRRRRYYSESPNKCWHDDGYDKLKPYGLPIHGCIDGYSRKIIWLKVARSNNDPLIPAKYYFEAINSLSLLPTNIRRDARTENGIIFLSFLTRNRDSHKYGSSHYNQIIEGWWSFYKKSFSTWVINMFQDFIETGFLVYGHNVHLELVWFIFSNLQQEELDAVKYQFSP